jgi:5-methylcytosine-specific restriction protein A
LSQGEGEEPNRVHTNGALSKKLTLAELRAIALESVSAHAPIEVKRINVARRAEAIRAYALARAQGTCESCKVQAPFKSKEGPFLEVHHVFRLGDGGPDHPDRVIALCPNCHRRAHYSIDADTFNQGLIQWLTEHTASPR